MPDDLRTRIAAALVQHHTAEDRDCKWPLQCECDAGWRSPEEWARHVADAVIAALGLERQDHYDPDCDHYRYVTDWIFK